MVIFRAQFLKECMYFSLDFFLHYKGKKQGLIQSSYMEGILDSFGFSLPQFNIYLNLYI